MPNFFYKEGSTMNSGKIWLTTDNLKYYLHHRILSAPPVSSEGEGSPIIWPMSKQMTVQRLPTIIIWTE